VIRVVSGFTQPHAPLPPPTTPIVDLFCHERDILSSSTDSDSPPTASQRENRPPLRDVQSRPSSSLSVVSSVRSVASRTLYQRTQLATQLVTTVQHQLKCTRDDAEQREQKMYNDIAEREHRLLADAAEREHRLLSDAAERDRRTCELEAQREQFLLHDAKCAREALLADVQLQRDREAQREIDLRRDLYDLSRQHSRAAALEEELKCLKATANPPTVAYEIVEVPVQSDDIAPPDVDTVVQLSPSRPDTPVDNLVVQRLPPDMTQRQPSTSAGPDVADTLIRHSHAADTRTVYSCHSTSTSTLQPSFMPSHEPTMYRPGPQHTQPQQYLASDPVFTQYQSDTQPRMPATRAMTDQAYAHTRVHTFPRSMNEPACNQSTVTSALPRQPTATAALYVVRCLVQPGVYADSFTYTRWPTAQ